jgi:hypothetical protein
LFVGAIIGVVAVVAVLLASYFDRTLDLHGWPWLVLLFLLGPAGLFVGVAPTILFCIRVDGGRIQHLFAHRFILSDYPIEDFVGLDTRASGWAAVLHFTGGRKIRFWGTHLREIERLVRDLCDDATRTVYPCDGANGWPLWFLTLHEIPPPTRSDALSRQQSLILFSLGLCPASS